MTCIIVFLKVLSDMSSLILTTLGPSEHSNNNPSDDESMSSSQYIQQEMHSLCFKPYGKYQKQMG